MKNKMNALRVGFNFACFATAFGMTLLWGYKYLKDDDLSKVNVKPFDLLSDGEYPMLSLCFYDSISESKLNRYNFTTFQSYLEVMIKHESSNTLDKLDLDDISLDLSEYYVEDAIKFRNGTTVGRSYPPFLNELPRASYSTFWDLGLGLRYAKCFGLRSVYKNAAYARFGFNSSVFINGTRDMFGIVFHLPNKFLMARSSLKDTWQKYRKENGFEMEFHLQQIEILKRRDKRTSPCVSDELNYDETILNDYIEKAQCKAPNQKTKKNWKLCDSVEKWINVSYIVELEHSRISCTSTATITYTYQEYDHGLFEFDKYWFGVNVYFPGIYKEIRMVKAVDIQTAIGNAGGYIGLFLGYAVLQLPDLIMKLQRLLEECIVTLTAKLFSRKLGA